MMNAYYGPAYSPFEKQGIGVFTYRPGMGKSYALRCFASSLNPSLYHMEYMCLSTISVADFYKQLCAMLVVSEKGGKPAMFAAVREQITYLYKEKRQPLFLAIDEAQYLNTGSLNDIKMLMNYGCDYDCGLLWHCAVREAVAANSNCGCRLPQCAVGHSMLKHILNKYPISSRRVLNKYMSHRPHQLPILYNRASAHD